MPDLIVERLDRFRAAAEEHLLPMLPGASLGDVGSSQSSSSQWSSWKSGAVSFKLRPEVPSRHFMSVSRTQRFFQGDRDVAEAFAQEFDLIERSGVSSEALRETLTAGIGQRVAVRVAANSAGLGSGPTDVLARQIAVLRSWASQTYEGNAIASAFALDLATTGTESSPNLADYANLPAAMVLGDGVTSFQVFGANGRLDRFECLEEPDESGAETFRYPHVFRRPAAWTINGGRTVACLTRRGETLVFAQGAMHFASRRGTWFHANHDGAITTWTKIHEVALRRAVYETTLDASFARTGACVAVLNGSGVNRALGDDKTVKLRDLVGHPAAGAKGSTFAGIIGGLRFQQLSRDVRRQLVAVDGATVLAPDGTVLAVGAIVSVPGGSDGGGRLAATRALAAHGFAVKVSADGQIRAYQIDSLIEPNFVGL